MAFFSWTGKKNVLMTCVYHSNVLVVEGYFFYRALVVVFNRRKLTTLVYYVIGYGVPTVTVIVLVLVNVLAGVEMYLRRNDQGTLESCFLSVEAMPAIAVPAGVSLMFMMDVPMSSAHCRSGLCIQPGRHNESCSHGLQGRQTEVRRTEAVLCLS